MGREIPDGYEDGIDIARYVSVIRRSFWKIAGLSAAVAVATFGGMTFLPNVYRASALITPPAEENRQMTSLGALASVGLVPGGATRLEDLEVLFRSNDLNLRVFRKYGLWNAIRPPGNPSPPPSDWDLIRAGNDALSVAANRRAGTVAVSFDSRFPAVSENAVRYYLDEARWTLQEEALDRAAKNKKFLEEQIVRVVDPLAKDRLFQLLGQEIEKEMLARNREQFGFKVVDSPRAIDRKVGPHRVRNSLAAALFAALLLMVAFIVLDRRGKREPSGE